MLETASFDGLLRGIRVIPDDVAEGLERQRRRDLVRETWDLVPRGQHKGQCCPELAEAARSYDRNRSIVLLGPTGCGKTTAAARIVAKLCQAAVAEGGDQLALLRSTYWVRASEVIAAGGNESSDASAMETIRKATRCRLLVLDDVARWTPTLTRVLELRCDGRRRPTIVTSGALDRNQFTEFIGGQGPYRWVLQSGPLDGKVVIGA